MTRTIEAQEINGKLYYTPAQFAHIIGRSENMLYKLINKGNCFRRLKCSYEYFGRPLIEADEVTRYPFTGPGRYPEKDVHHVTLEGDRVSCVECSTLGPGHCNATREERNG